MKYIIHITREASHVFNTNTQLWTDYYTTNSDGDLEFIWVKETHTLNKRYVVSIQTVADRTT